jgi:hypothetical protein
MPPWLPEPGYGTFVNERRLKPEEIATIQEWVKAGAPRGAATELPPRPTWTDGWQLGTPDLVVKLAEPFVLPQGGGEVFRNFALSIPITTTRYVRGIEVRPGNARVVHHASLSFDRTRASRLRDEADPLPGFSGGMFSDTARNPESRALGWTPGMTPSFEPDGMPWRLEKGSDLVLELHLIPGATQAPQTVQPSVGFYQRHRRRGARSISRSDRKTSTYQQDDPSMRSRTVTRPVDVDVLERLSARALLARR